MKDLAIFKENICKHTRKKSLPDEKTLNGYHYLGRKYNTFHFGEKRQKIKNMLSLLAFFINM